MHDRYSIESFINAQVCLAAKFAIEAKYARMSTLERNRKVALCRLFASCIYIYHKRNGKKFNCNLYARVQF